MNKHADVLAALAAPFPPDVVKHRPGVGGKDLSWVDARTVAARLDEVLGVNGWDFDVEVLDDGKVVRGTLFVRFPDGSSARRADFGYETGGSGESLKEAASDALRRCASLFGVARYLYQGERGAPSLPRPFQRIPAPTPDSAEEQTTDAAVALRAAQLFAQQQDEGSCPDGHGPWQQRPGGVSKTTGKPYAAFWTCGGKTSSGYCKRKPSIGWINAQSAPVAPAADTLDDIPF